MKDPCCYSITQGSFNKDMGSGPKTKSSSRGPSIGGTAFNAADEFGSGKATYSGDKGGLVSPTMKGAEDHSLIKSYSK